MAMPKLSQAARHGGMITRLLALDLGTSVGWASYIDGMVQSGVISFKSKAGDLPGVRYLSFDAWLAETLGRVQPHLVIYEDAFMQPRREGTIIAYGFVTRVWAACASLGIEVTSVNATRLKKATTGDGWASKAKMLQAVNERWHLCIGVEHRCTSIAQTVNRRRADKVLDYCADPSHDEADAMAALRWCLETYGK